MTIFQGPGEIFIYLLLLSPLMPESCHIFASLIYKNLCNTQGSYFQNNYS